jgi:hypothetical protein
MRGAFRGAARGWKTVLHSAFVAFLAYVLVGLRSDLRPIRTDLRSMRRVVGSIESDVGHIESDVSSIEADAASIKLSTLYSANQRQHRN